MIAQYRAEFPLRVMCRVLQVSPAGFYRWQHRGPSVRRQEDTQLQVQIAAFHRQSRRRYGSPRIHEDLRAAGAQVGRKRVARLMRAAGLRGTPRRAFRITTQSDDRQVPAPNHLARQFAVAQPNRVWATDVTYLRTDQGWLYLAVLIDLASRRVVGWAVAPRLDRHLVLTALHQALMTRQPARGLLHHSDRGQTYTCGDYRAALQAAGIAVSMSRRGDCWDNAVVESFFATLKRELVSQERWATRGQAEKAVRDYLAWYNQQRRHSTLGYLSPAAFEARLSGRLA
jgi:transposase InsO family protein